MKANMQKLPGIGAFCDDMRDALRGPFSNNDQGAFLIGEKGHEESIKFGIVGCIAHPEVNMQKVNYSKQAWTAQPTQSINYVSCHDDMMLTDRLKANKKLAPGELQALSKLAQTAVLTSQGIPFLWCGEEIARDKKGVHNSYCSPDEINAIDWSLKAENIDLFQYYQGLIAMRKAHPVFHMGDAELVRKNVHFLPVKDGVVAYQLNGKAVGDTWKKVVVILNSHEDAVAVKLPGGTYYVACADGKCPVAQPTKVSGTVKVAAQSAMILYVK
jgi:pullulanase